ncbi:MAG: agmatine/peptidylarginine deiminase [Rubricoccaceae bacterium]
MPGKILVTDTPALPSPTPHALGYRMPAEWERHQGTWLTWPHCEATWPGKLPSVTAPYVAMVRALSRGETVHINVKSEAHAAEVETILREAGMASGPGTPIRLHVIPTDDEWIRDYGALVVAREDGLAATDWLFNAWGNKYDRTERNNRVPAAMADYLNVPTFRCPIVLEGGSVDVNGHGLALTTEACLLNPNRNPALTKEDVETWLEAGLGVRETIWLGDGIAGDDTDGHVDDLARFVAPDTVVTVVEDDPGDVNYAPLQDNLRRLERHRLRSGEALRVVPLPMPRPVFHDGERLPASYANFYIGNKVVLLPVFDDPADAVARETLQVLFPQREIVGIPGTDLVWGLGACHCLTQQVPARPGSAPGGS